MACRLYLPTSTAAPVSPAFDASWVDTEDALRRKLEPYPTGSTGSTALVNCDEAVSTTVQSLGHQYVSNATLLAGPIGGTFSAAFTTSQSGGGTDAFMRLVIKVVSPDGATVRGTLFSGLAATENGTSGAVRIFNSVALTPIVATAGDRLVVEVGVEFQNAIGTNQNAGFNAGDPIQSGTTMAADLPLDQGFNSGSLDRPWIEFSQDIFPADIRAGAVATEAMIVGEPALRVGSAMAEALVVGVPELRLGALVVECLVPLAGQKIPGLYVVGDRSRTPLMKGPDGAWRAVRPVLYPEP